MTALLIWLQSWQVATAYKQMVQNLKVFSGHTQQAWVGYLTTRAGKTHLHLHLIDTSGYEPLGRNGACLSCGDNLSVNTWEASVGEKNWLYISWSTEQKTQIQSLDPEGIMRWRAEAMFPARQISLLPHPEGGAVALLRSERALKLYFWDSSGKVQIEQDLLPSEMPCRSARLISSSVEGFIALWEAYTGSRWEVFFQKWLWKNKPDAPARPLSQLSHSIEGMEIIGDGFGGMLGVYESVSLTGSGKDLHLVRYNRSGTRLYEVPLCQEAGDQQKPRIYKRGTDLLIVWEDNRNQDWDLYYQRVDISSGRLLLAAEGVPLVRLPGPQHHPEIILDYFQNEMIVIWEDYRRIQGDIYLQRYTADAKPLWEFTGRPLATGQPQQYQFCTAAQDFQLFWVAYLEDEGEAGIQPHIALLTTQGESRLHRRLAGNTSQPFARAAALTAHPWKENLLLIWQDNRDDNQLPQLYVQLLSSERKPLWGPYGIPISPQTTLTQKNPRIHFQGDTAWILWEGEESDVESDLFVQALTLQGRKLFSKPLPICLADRVQTEAQWVAHAHHLYAYWTDNRSMEETGFDLYLRQIVPLSPEIGWRVTRSFQNSAHIAPSGDPNRLHHLWQEDVNGKYQVAYALSAIGEVGTPILLSPTSRPQRFLHSVTDASGQLYAAFCEEARGPYEQALRLFAISPLGEIRWQLTSPSAYKHHLYPKLFILPTGELLTLYLATSDSKLWDLLFLLTSKDGNVLLKGSLLSPVPERSEYTMVATKSGYWLLLRMPNGHNLYHSSRLESMKPRKLPGSCAEGYLFSWQGEPFLFWTDVERKTLTLSPLSPSP
ncbi:MAG: hypothetical protein NZZ60_08715 [Bacteroidia bacterium]|nr:hypothetical protein [Bacteroidia bacterium]MCX7652849.1 hypothetical protein [Bacteroidia bacterium]MDW8417597.1 hypothetical protein [Bacteroidia bacterium]